MTAIADRITTEYGLCQTCHRPVQSYGRNWCHTETGLFTCTDHSDGFSPGIAVPDAGTLYDDGYASGYTDGLRDAESP